MNKNQDWRFVRADKEALFALGAYALYFLWWYVCAYGMGDGSPENYAYVWGLPEWFFYSCIVGYPLVTVLLWGMVRFLFKDMPLDDDPAESTLEPEGALERESHAGDEPREGRA